MTLQLHNTRTRTLEPFKSQKEGEALLYTCGPTVYNFLHVGNWAAYIYWDTLVRTLQMDGYAVRRVMNITDVGHLTSDQDEGEDKLQKGARREGKTAWEIAKLYSDDFVAGMRTLNLLPATTLAPATEYIQQQLDLIRTLKEKGVTYEISDGIYFDTAQFPAYAEFAKLDLAAQQAGARVNYNTEKRNPSDFALWKFSPLDEQRDMEWETPHDIRDDTASDARMGFPGWHLECSAIALSLLGDTLDIHTGGIDHIPVHHTNEIAQSEAATGALFSNFWLHNNHMKVNGTKISKSLGNGYTLSDLAEKGFSPLEYKLFVLQTHYRSEGNFTFENLGAAKQRLAHWRAVAALRWQTHDTLVSEEEKLHGDATPRIHTAVQAVKNALNADLNTPLALSEIDAAFSAIEAAPVSHIHQYSLVQLLETIDELLGLELLATTPDISEDAKRLIVARAAARGEKDWAAADAARDALLSQNITVRDTANGSIWSYSN